MSRERIKSLDDNEQIQLKSSLDLMASALAQVRRGRFEMVSDVRKVCTIPISKALCTIRKFSVRSVTCPGTF